MMGHTRDVAVALALLEELGYTVTPPLKLQKGRRPQISTYEREEYQKIASRKGWTGGSVAADWLSSVERMACDLRAKERWDADFPEAG